MDNGRKTLGLITKKERKLWRTEQMTPEYFLKYWVMTEDCAFLSIIVSVPVEKWNHSKDTCRRHSIVLIVADHIYLPMYHLDIYNLSNISICLSVCLSSICLSIIYLLLIVGGMWCGMVLVSVGFIELFKIGSWLLPCWDRLFFISAGLPTPTLLA